MDPWASTNQGLANLTSTLGTLAQFKRQDRLDAEQAQDHAKARTLADLQLKTEQQKFDDKAALRTELANVQGKYLYPEPQGVGPMQPEKAQTLSDLGPVQQPTTAENRLGVMADLASKGNTAAMEQYGNAYSLNQKLAEQRAKVAEYGDLESAARIDEMLGKMEKSGKLLESWMKTDPTGEMAKQGIVAMPDLFPNFDPAKMKIGKQGEPPAYFDAPDGGHTFFDGKEWKHIAAAKPDPEIMMDKRFANQQKLQADQIAAADRRTAQQIAAADRRAASKGAADGLGKLDIESAKVLIRTLPKLKEEATAANGSIERIDTMLSLVKSGVGGKKGQILSTLAPYAELAGVNTKGMNDAQTYEIMAKTIGGSMRMQIVGPGPVSNYENQLLQKISGGGSAATPAATELLGYYRKMAKEKVDDYNGSVESVSEFSPATKKIYRKIGGGPQQPSAAAQPKGKSAGYSDLLNKHRK
jgi:hypothetical protein